MAIKGLKEGVYLHDNTYRIEGILGQGSFGITYLATARLMTEGNLGKLEVEAKVAIKEFFMGEVNSRKEGTREVEGSSGNVFTNYRRKFRKEAENLARLSSRNIVRVLDVFDENHTTYYVMEFIEGQNLDEYISSKGSIPEEEAIEIIKEVGRAVDYMHSKKMLHLDMKPKNIMRRNDGSVCLIDFGLSKQFTEGGEPESSTSIGLGTPGYAPIEQSSYRQDGTFPATLDVYALGATFFKMLTGSRPADATIILNDGFPEADLRAKGISANTVAALKNAMNPFRNKRTQSIQEFLDALSPVEDNDDDESTSYCVDGDAGIGIAEETEVEIPQGPSQPAPDPDAGSDYGQPAPLDESGLPVYDHGEKKSHKGAITTVLITLFSALAVVGVVWLINSKPSSDNPQDATKALPYVEKKEILTVSKMPWDSPLGPAIYSGEVVPDSIDEMKFIPHGNGTAEIIDSVYAGNTYEGQFVNGNMEGYALYTQKSGDIFKGKFKDNQYDEGIYTIYPSGEYYRGTFRDGDLWKGIWYDKNGNKKETVNKK